ncbi:MAG: solute carrier family 23 protein, partial [Candidatus Coproplasma sp.]
MKLIYGVKDRPSIPRIILFALQQLLAILAATIAVPMIINGVMEKNGFTDGFMSPSAALFGAGVGTLVYLLFTKFKSPVFLGSSFAFLGSMAAAFAGGVTASLGYLGLIIGAIFAGLVYVIIAIIVKFAGVKWINKIMPAVVIGPTVAIIGLSLAGNAVGDLTTGSVTQQITEWVIKYTETGAPYLAEETVNQVVASPYVCLVCGLVTLAVTMVCSVYGKKLLKMIPFIIGILAGYAVAAIFTGIGFWANVDALKVIDFSKFSNMQWYPDFAFVQAFFNADYGSTDIGAYIGTIAVAYIPVAFVVFAEHIADHKNISSIIETDL